MKIEKHPFKQKSKNPNIRASMDFRAYSALTEIATLDELEKYEAGLYSKELIAKVVAYTELKNSVVSHNHDANYVKPKKGR